MRRLTIIAILVAFALPGRALAADETTEQLKKRVETTRPEDRISLCLQIAHQQLRSADKLYTDGKAEEALAAVDDIVTYAEKAGDDATHTNKHLKNVEISARKLSEKLRDIKRTLAFDDQPAVEKAIVRLETLRTSLLKEMFRKEKKK
jgi:hypothetical protein